MKFLWKEYKCNDISIKFPPLLSILFESHWKSGIREASKAISNVSTLSESQLLPFLWVFFYFFFKYLRNMFYCYEKAFNNLFSEHTNKIMSFILVYKLIYIYMHICIDRSYFIPIHSLPPVVSCTPAPLHPCPCNLVSFLLLTSLTFTLCHMNHIPLSFTPSLKKNFKLRISHHFSTTTFAPVTMKQIMTLNSHNIYSATIHRKSYRMPKRASEKNMIKMSPPPACVLSSARRCAKESK